MAERPSQPPRLLLPNAPALVAEHGRAALLTPDGEFVWLSGAELLARDDTPPMLVHGPATARRLGVPLIPGAHDLLELFAFCCPAQPCAPTPRGLAMALGLEPPHSVEALAALLPEMATTILRGLARRRAELINHDAASLAARMAEAADWPWAASVMAALGQDAALPATHGLKPWRRLPEWEDTAPPPVPGSHGVEPREARQRLAEMLGGGSEQRPQQADYASAAAAAFAPREAPGAPRMVLAEAGTGTGKTLGYIAPASLWAERNGAPVWISTFTRNLQRQIDQELARLYPDPEARRRKVAIRKGRENYLCLLNLEEAAASASLGGQTVPLALVARWVLATRDGDLMGGDFPGWLGEIFGQQAVAPLGDRRGECIHSACSHYKTCFVEHSIRRARSATIVIANHALVMVQAAFGGGEDGRPLRLVFDEGHHVFDAADSAFSAALTGGETAELRRWLLGAEGGRSRAKGLRRRLEDILGGKPDIMTPLDAALQAARALPPAGWYARLGEVDSDNPAEAFLRAVRLQVLARSTTTDTGYDSECDLHPIQPGLPVAAELFERAINRLEAPLKTLRDRLAGMLEDESEEMDAGARIRMEATCRSLERRALAPLATWGAMLRRVQAPPPEPGDRPDFVDWLALERREGRDIDAGMYRHFLDPTIPFATIVAAAAHGLLITSATLRDVGFDHDDPEAAWRGAEARTGAAHLPLPALRAAMTSPFDYASSTRAYVVSDLRQGDAGRLAGAMRALFLASGGGALGLFTAIRRLRETHARIAPALEAAGIPLYAQHIDAMDNASLVDVFRAEEDACLLGTDAMRDGVDVPGRSLRLLVFDRVPWQRPTILHRERRTHLSEGRAKDYDDAIARHRLRQAFGRLIRRADDKGVFVILDPRTPTRLLAGLPPGVEVQRLPLSDVVQAIGRFLGRSEAPG